MEFTVTWSVNFLSGTDARKKSDTYNRNMYLIDNLGHRYDHIGTGGAAQLGGSAHQGQFTVMDGTFLFPPAQPGASVFTFHDDDQHVTIPNLMLHTLAP